MVLLQFLARELVHATGMAKKKKKKKKKKLQKKKGGGGSGLARLS